MLSNQVHRGILKNQTNPAILKNPVSPVTLKNPVSPAILKNPANRETLRNLVRQVTEQNPKGVKFPRKHKKVIQSCLLLRNRQRWTLNREKCLRKSSRISRRNSAKSRVKVKGTLGSFRSKPYRL